MGNERELKSILGLMVALNLAVILFYSMICYATPLRVCRSFTAYAFLSSLRRLPPYPWQMPLEALTLYLLLCSLILGKSHWQIERFQARLLLCGAEIALCVGVAWALNFYDCGVALLVLADVSANDKMQENAEEKM